MTAIYNIKQIAEICHAANRTYCSTIGDYSQLSWAHAPEWQEESACKGVMHALENPDAKPEDSHNSWLAEKEADGWQYGPVKDPEAKTHPCFVPYDQLPEEQKLKDKLFLAVVSAFRPVESAEDAPEGGARTTEEHEGLPVSGYRSQSTKSVEIVNANKAVEERFLRTLDGLADHPGIDQRWLAIGRTHIEEGFMAINRSIFKPDRVTFPGDPTTNT